MRNQRKPTQDQPFIIVSDGKTQRVIRAPRSASGNQSVLIYGITRFAIIPFLVVVFWLVAEKYLPPADNQNSVMYADPTRDFKPTYDLSWKTPVSKELLMTPENLRAILSQTPITPAPTQTLAPTQTPNPTQEPYKSPTPIPTATWDLSPYKTAEAEKTLADVAQDIQKHQAITDQITKFIDFMGKVISFLCAGSATVLTIILIVLVVTRVKRELATIRAEMERAAILANPVLAYPKGTRAEIENVLNLMKANVKYYQDHALDPNEQIKIMRFSYLENINTDQWTRATDSLVRRGYAMKQPGKATILKYNLTIGAMLEIINQALYLDTNSIALTLKHTPS